MTQEQSHETIIDISKVTPQHRQVLNAFDAFDNNEVQDATCPFFNFDSSLTFFNVTPRSRNSRSKGTSSTQSFASATRAYETISLSDEFRIVDPLCSEASDEEYEQWNRIMALSLQKAKSSKKAPHKQIHVDLVDGIEIPDQAIHLLRDSKEKSDEEKLRKPNENRKERKENSSLKHSKTKPSESKGHKKANSKDFRISKHTQGRSRVASLYDCNNNNDSNDDNHNNSLAIVERMLKDVHLNNLENNSENFTDNRFENNRTDKMFRDFKTKPLKSSSSVKTNSFCEFSSRSQILSSNNSPKRRIISGNKVSEGIPISLQSRKSSTSLLSSNSSLSSTVSETESSSYTSTASFRVSPPTSVIVSPTSSNELKKAVPPVIPKLKLQTQNQTQNQQLPRVPNTSVSVNPSTQLRLQLTSANSVSTSPVSSPRYYPIPTSPTCLLSPRSAFIHSPRKRFEAHQSQSHASFHEQPKPNARAISRVVRRKKARSLIANETKQENDEGN